MGSAFKALYVGQQLASPMILRQLVGAIAQDQTDGIVYAVILVCRPRLSKTPLSERAARSHIAEL